MAGLTTAWELSSDAQRDNIASVTVYQRGWRLGGKGASSRGPNGRIEEHGLHVLLGYYHATFAMMQACYDELDRERTRPAAPLRTWSDAVKPSGDISLTERTETGWEPWSTHFSITDEMPGTDGQPVHGQSLGRLGIAEVVRRSFQLIIDFHGSAASRSPGDAAATGGVVLSPSPNRPDEANSEATRLALRAMGLTALAGACELLDQLGDATASLRARNSLLSAVQDTLSSAQDALAATVADGAELRRTRTLVDLVFTNLRGMIADGLLSSTAGFNAIDHLDYREWLSTHGAAAATLDSGLLRGMYDLVFAYREGSGDRPAFAAGLGLDLATRMLLDYRGSIFWKMQAGMGEVIFAPLYEVLRKRGVEFRFFHELEAVNLCEREASVESIRLRQQAGTCTADYDPLIDADGLPAWPCRPNYDQLATMCRDRLDDTESAAHSPIGDDIVELRSGQDFDVAVLAVSIGIIPSVCADLVSSNPRWKAMVDNVGTVSTQALQLWLSSTEAELGWPGPAGTTLSGFRQPFDTWASMSHLIEREDWPNDEQPSTIAYFCSTFDETDHGDGETDDAVRQQAIEFMNTDLRYLWPHAVGDDGFDWQRLVPAAEGMDGQYWRANDDPSDRYVQSLPGSDRFRLRPDESGYSNLFLAGDWTNCGLNAGCIEAATLSGLLAAEAVVRAAP